MTSLTGNKGFTFFELILVILILAIIIGISVPLLRKSFDDFLLRTSISQIRDLLIFAKQRSIIENKIHQLNFINDKSFYITFLNNQTEPQRIKGRWAKTFHLPQGIYLETKNNKINFYPDGSTDRIEILIKSKDKKIILENKGAFLYSEKISD